MLLNKRQRKWADAKSLHTDNSVLNGNSNLENNDVFHLTRIIVKCILNAVQCKFFLIPSKGNSF